MRGAPAFRSPEVAIDWGLGYEALVGLALFIGGEPDSTYELGESWFRTLRRKASPGLRDAARQLVGKEGYLVTGLAGLLREERAKSVAAVVARMRRDRSGETKRALLHSDPAMLEALLRREREAEEKYIDHFRPASRAAVRRAIGMDPAKLAAETADLVERWDEEVFSDIGPPLADELEASAHAASRLSRQLPGDRLIVKLTRGVDYRPEPWISSVVLVPSILNRPWVDITEYGGTKFFFYPASTGAVPDTQLVEVYKALGDETRLRILRLIATGVNSLTEIAEKLGLAKSTVHEHMVVLRTAGLTRSVVGSEGKRYELNERPDLNLLLDTYLGSQRR